MFRRIVSLVVVTTFGLVLTGCAPESGTVTDRSKEREFRRVGSATLQVWDYDIQITSPSGESGWTDVTESEYRRCGMGAAYPTCLKG